MKKTHRITVAMAALTLCSAAKLDPENPTCPVEPNWGEKAAMTLTPVDRGNKRVLLADGVIDRGLPARLQKAIDEDELVEEVWFRSRGGDALAGNEAGKVIRSFPGIGTRIPDGWTCFSACNFVFMGGRRRHVDKGGVFMVHMFTHTSQRDVIDLAVEGGTKDTVQLIGDIEQSSALLASEDNDFLIRMGVSRKLLTEIMYQQSATSGDRLKGSRYCLTQDEAVEYNVMNVKPAG